MDAPKRIRFRGLRDSHRGSRRVHVCVCGSRGFENECVTKRRGAVARPEPALADFPRPQGSAVARPRTARDEEASSVHVRAAIPPYGYVLHAAVCTMCIGLHPSLAEFLALSTFLYCSSALYTCVYMGTDTHRTWRTHNTAPFHVSSTWIQ